MADKWLYNGDVSLVHGGSFIDLSSFDDGYCCAVRVTDLDSACGFTGAVLIEHVVINGTTDCKRIRQALKCVGGLQGRGFTKENLRWQIASALLEYGCYEPNDSWDSYASHWSETVQCEDGPMQFDGWKAHKRLRGTSLEDYVRSVHLEE